MDQVRESPVEVHGGQAALKTVPGGHKFGQITVHALCQASNVQVTCEHRENMTLKRTAHYYYR